jgi:hypothetical protein
MKFKNSSIFFVLFFLIAWELSALEPVMENSLQSAKQWLSLIDEADYDRSWETGSLTFRLTINKQHWNTLMQSIRKPLGKPIERKMLEMRPAKDPSGLPKGDYMVIFFETLFPNTKKTHELVTLVQESDGNWRVLTYQVQ